MSQWTVPEHVLTRQLGEECVILDVDNGTYFGLDAIGSHIWQMLSEKASPEEIAARLARDYDVAPEQAMADLTRLVEELTASGLVRTE